MSFVKCGKGKDAPWVFFDSMADRMGKENNYWLINVWKANVISPLSVFISPNCVLIIEFDISKVDNL